MNDKPYSRRTFLKLSTAAAAGLSISAAPNHRDMPHRILGRTGEAVSLLGLGGAHVADHGNMEEKAAIALMHAAIDEGINFFDNAWGYSNGASEDPHGQGTARRLSRPRIPNDQGREPPPQAGDGPPRRELASAANRRD